MADIGLNTHLSTVLSINRYYSTHLAYFRYFRVSYRANSALYYGFMNVKDIKKEIAKEIISRRDVLGITQEKLSDLSEVGLKTIYKLEQGVGNPSVHTVEQVLDVLGLELSIKLKKQ